MNGIREENLLGSLKVIVGKATEDLILETLGKVYIKSGRNFTLLNDVISKITDLANQVSNDPSSINSKVFIIENMTKFGTYEDGSLVFDAQTLTLYMVINGLPVLLVEAKYPTSDKYVRKAGDIMTGLLILTYEGGPSLTVKSLALVLNLNADRLDNYHVLALAIKAKDETITGNWTHEGTTTFNNLANFNNNISQQGGGFFTNNYIGTKQFIPGFLGVGWCVLPDDTGYTLTVDNLVVRKAMEVFELIVNKINATNGSMWISDYAKVFISQRVLIITSDAQISKLATNWFVKYTKEEEGKSYNTVKIDKSHISNSLELKNGLLEYIVFNKVFFIPFPKTSKSEDIKEFTLFENPEVITGIKENSTSIEEEYIMAKFRVAPESMYDENGNLIPNVSLINNKYTYKEDTNVWTYYRYFGVTKESLISMINSENSMMRLPGLFMTEFESEDCIPTLWEGDLVRCQKYLDGSIRYYDGLVGKSITTSKEVLINGETVEELQDNNYILPIFTITSGTMGSTEVYYDDETNTVTRNQVTVIYEKPKVKTENGETVIDNKNSATIELIQRGDVIVRIGNVYDQRRQGAIYLTSSEVNSPYLNMISEVNRPDYSVIYYTPKYKTFTSLVGENPKKHYQDFYVQSKRFNRAFENTSDSTFNDIYKSYTIKQDLAKSALDPESSKDVETPKNGQICLTNSITDNTSFDGKIPASINYTTLSRLLYISGLNSEPYVVTSSFIDSKEATKYNGLTYCIGSL